MAGIEEFNDQPPDRAVEALRACNAAPRFAAELVAGRPFRDAETLVSRAEEVVRGLPWDEVALALAAHPGSATGWRVRAPRRRRPARSRAP